MSNYWITISMVAALSCIGNSQQYVSISTDRHCYNVDDSMTITAAYTGSKSALHIRLVVTGANTPLIVQHASCSQQGRPDAAFPIGMSFICTKPNTYNINISRLAKVDIHKTWKIDFLLNTKPDSGTAVLNVSECAAATLTTTARDTTEANVGTTARDTTGTNVGTLPAGGNGFTQMQAGKEVRMIIGMIVAVKMYLV